MKALTYSKDLTMLLLLENVETEIWPHKGVSSRTSEVKF